MSNFNVLARPSASLCSGAAPPPAAPPKLSARKDKIRIDFVSKKNAKILKNFLLTQMAALVVVNLSRLKLPRTAIKKDDQKS
jgi:hypothetical protein